MAKNSEDKERSKKRGRPEGYRKLPVDPKLIAQVERLRGTGSTIEDIAYILGISPKTFHVMLNESVELATAIEAGRAKARSIVADAAFKMATSGKNGPLTMFWLRTQAGWKETVDIKVENKTTVVFETQYGDGVLRQTAKELPDAESKIIDAIIEDLMPSEDPWQSNELDSE